MSEAKGRAQPRHGATPVLLYFAPLTLLVYLIDPTGQFLDIALTYLLKDRLHANAAEAGLFRLVTAIPVYGAFVFGLARDLWNPFGRRDRGMLMLFAPLTAAVLLVLALLPVSYATLFAGIFLVMLLSRFLVASHQGLLALISQEQLMSGRLSVLWNIVSYIPYIAGALAAGYVAEHVSPVNFFVLLAALCLMLAVFALWKPRAVYGYAYEAPVARGTHLVGDLKRLVRHRAAYPAILIMLLFQFSPGTGIVLQFHLTDRLHATDAVYGEWYAIFLTSFVPVFLGYGHLCRRIAFGRLLRIAAWIAVPQVLPIVFAHSAESALWLAIPIGMMGGLIWAAIYDLAMRSCPPGLQGTLMMLVSGVNALGVRGGDLLGAYLYARDPVHGIAIAAMLSACFYAAIIPVIRLVPRELLATADGEPNPALDRAVRQELAGG